MRENGRKRRGIESTLCVFLLRKRGVKKKGGEKSIQTLKVNEDSVLSSPGLALADNNGGDDWETRKKTRQHEKKKKKRRREDAESRDSPFFLRSGFPFFTQQMTQFPTPALGRRLRRAPHPWTAMT